MSTAEQPWDLAAPASPILRVLVEGREPETMRTVNFLIGSGMHCDLCLVGSGINREHAHVRHTPSDGWVLRELRPAGLAAPEGPLATTAIVDGAVVRIGPYQMTFELRRLTPSARWS